MEEGLQEPLTLVMETGLPPVLDSERDSEEGSVESSEASGEEGN